jgi:hypothetical protein
MAVVEKVGAAVVVEVVALGAAVVLVVTTWF